MLKFRNNVTGIIEEPRNPKVIEQYIKSELYEKVGELPQANEPVGALCDYTSYTVKELKQKANALGITYRAKSTKSELIALINHAN